MAGPWGITAAPGEDGLKGIPAVLTLPLLLSPPYTARGQAAVTQGKAKASDLGALLTLDSKPPSSFPPPRER